MSGSNQWASAATAAVVTPTAMNTSVETGSQVAQRGVEGGIQQDRRHEQRQRQIGLQRPGRAGWHKGQQHAADGEKGRVGHLDPPGQRRQQHRAKQQGNQPFECRQTWGSLSPGLVGQSPAI
jgi:hypothetical protein